MIQLFYDIVEGSFDTRYEVVTVLKIQVVTPYSVAALHGVTTQD
jgi:hypothetical protein